MQETWVRSLGQEDPLEEGTAAHSSILAWRVPWTEELDGLQSMGSQRVGHDRTTKHLIQRKGGREVKDLHHNGESDPGGAPRCVGLQNPCF